MDQSSLPRLQRNILRLQHAYGTVLAITVVTIFSTVLSLAICLPIIYLTRGGLVVDGDWMPLGLSVGTPLIVTPLVAHQTLTVLAFARSAYERLDQVASQLTDEVMERVATQHVLEQLAATDPLTGLSNRRGFFDWVRQRQSSDLDIRVFVVDADDFKSINDQFGHAIGDAALIEIAHRLSGVAELIGGHTARMGGDEFVVATESLDSTDLVQEALCDIVFTVEGHGPVEVRCTIGTTQVAPGESIDVALRRADVDLYSQKSDCSSTSAAQR